jgi:ABC-2 type transport system permease protein
MNLNLFLKEIKRNVFSLLIWTIIITLLISLTMLAYRTFLENQSKIMGMIDLVPKGALQFKGVSNLNDLFSVLGFYSANNVIYMMVLGSIFSIVLASNILLKEEYNKTSEFLLTWPLTRSEIFLSKLAVIFLNVLLLNLVTSLAGLLIMELVRTGPLSIKAFLILSLNTLMLNILFGAIGLFISTLIKRSKPITTLSIGLVLFFYFIYTISKITVSIAKIGYLSPFKYASVDSVSSLNNLNFWHIIYFIGLSFFLTILAYRFYKKKEIYT